MKLFSFLAVYMLISLSIRAQVPEPDDTMGVQIMPASPVFKDPEIKASFPKGDHAWQRFLTKHFTYSKEAEKEGIQGIVIVRFVIEADGSVTNIEAVSGPNELRADAIGAIEKSPKWIPAQSDGRKVRSYRSQPIVFRLQQRGS